MKIAEVRAEVFAALQLSTDEAGAFDGEWFANGNRMSVCSPIDGSVLAEVRQASVTDYGRAAEATALVGLVNAYDRRNLFAFDVFTLRRSDQLPLVPVVGFRLGV